MSDPETFNRSQSVHGELQIEVHTDLITSEGVGSTMGVLGKQPTIRLVFQGPV